MSKRSVADPPATLREINVEARRRRILDAARSLIAKGGMAALSMRKLATEAGLSVTTLYNLYGVRDEILHALIDDAVDRAVGRGVQFFRPELHEPLGLLRGVLLGVDKNVRLVLRVPEVLLLDGQAGGERRHPKVQLVQEDHAHHFEAHSTG